MQHSVAQGFAIYGDPAYNLEDYFISGFVDNIDTTLEQRQFNSRMSSVRVSVEWSFGKVMNLFRALQYPKSLKVYLQRVGLMYRIAVVFTNIHTCYNGGLIVEYFGMQLSIEDYMHHCENCLSE